MKSTPPGLREAVDSSYNHTNQMTMKLNKIILSLLAMAAAVSVMAQTNEMKIRVNKPGAEIQPTMYGIFIEDINFAATFGTHLRDSPESPSLSVLPGNS